MPLLRCLCAVLLAVGLSGCGDSTEMVPVSGTVTTEEGPLPGAAVTFYPTGDTGSVLGNGTTGQDGKYTITPSRGKNGLQPGEYIVIVSRRLRPDGSPPDPKVPPMESDARETLPNNYTSRESTPLRAKVSKESPTHDFALKVGKK